MSADAQRAAGAAGGDLTLAIDASTYAGSVAILRGDRVLVERTVAMRGETEERLMPAVVDALAAADAGPSSLARVVCGAGPGSFTSLRIAASIAKGVGSGAGLPLHAAPSLALIVSAARPELGDGRWLAALDAGRGESFVALVETVGGVTRAEAPRLMSRSTLADAAHAQGLRVVGPAPEHAGLAPHARGVAGLAVGMIPRVDLTGWEPDYGRLAEAQVQWEARHGRPLPLG